MDINNWESYFQGVVSSVLAVGLIWLVTKQAWPRLWNFVQKGPRISGQWTSTFEEEGTEKSEIVEVSQSGEKIHGTMILTEKSGPTIKSSFTGTIQSGVIKGLYENQNPEGFEQGAFVLYLNPRGLQASGQYIYFFTEEDGSTSELTSSPYSWKKG